MHPAFAKERVPDELCTVQANTLVLWAEDNAFHSWAKFKPLAAKLRQRLGDERYAEHRTRREADEAWSESARARAVVNFFTGLDPLPEAQVVMSRPEREAVAADGSAIRRADGVVFRSEVTEEMVRSADPAVDACAALVLAANAGTLPRLLRDLAGAGGAARASAMAVFARDLPALDDAALTPARLEALGLWTPRARAAAEALQESVAGSPRYFFGRRVLIPGGACVFGTLRAVNAAADEASVAISDGAGGELVMRLSWGELTRLNQRHVLPRATSDGTAVLRLEDGLWADFSSPLLRAELASVALALDAVFARDVAAALEAGDGNALDEARGAALVAMRNCLDVTSFSRDGGAERGRDRDRYAKDDVAKMAAHGEGHCRTLSSCFATFLWTFAELLAVDPHYCMDAGARHQWLQFETRPSMCSFACDLYRDEDAGGKGTLLAEPTSLAYAEPASIDGGSWQLFPADKPLALGGRRVTSASLEPTDVDM